MEKQGEMLDERAKKERELIESGARACINCVHWNREKPEADDGSCQRFPPTVFAFPIKGALGQPGFGTNCFFPRCRPEIQCGEFTPKASITMQ